MFQMVNQQQDYLNSKLILFNNLTKKGGNIIYDNDISQSKILKKICLKKNLNSVFQKDLQRTY